MNFKKFIKSYLKILIITISGNILILSGVFIFSLELKQEIDDFRLQTHQFYQHPFQVNAAVRRARFAISHLQNDILYALIEPNSSNQAMKEHKINLDKSLTIIEANFLGDMTKVQEIRNLTYILQKKYSEIFDHLIHKEANEARLLIHSIADPLYKKVLEKMDYIVNFSANKALHLVTESQDRAERLQTQLNSLLLFFALFTLLSGGITAVVIIRQLYIKDDKLQKNNDNLRISATVFETDQGMMVTDDKLTVLRVNKAFTIITGYDPIDIIGSQPKILTSGQYPPSFFDKIWKELARSGRWDGEIWNKRKNGELYPLKLILTAVKNLDSEVTNYVGIINDITKSKEFEKKIKDLAYYDPLTHLPNRRLMVERIHHALATNYRNNDVGALLFLDIDHFKTLNDTMGHDMGDLLLTQVGERLTQCVRESDTVSRFGGDEFVVLLEGLNHDPLIAVSQTKEIAKKILSSINAIYKLNSVNYTITTSIGITLFRDAQKNVEILLKEADIALYQSKDDGRNTIRFFDPQMQLRISKHAKLEKELNRAILQKEFQLHYQIQMDSDSCPIGAEALIRWAHPERGLVFPLEFISLAEQNGSIIVIGKWILETACEQLKLWENNVLTSDLTLSINVSAKQFHQTDFIASIKSAVREYNIKPALLKLELTESILLNDIQSTITKMQVLAKIGIQFSLDDFGTGYSSLQYLKQLPLYQLKIDKSFIDELVSNKSDQAIVRTIIVLAHSLGLNVIAEGVETREQQQILLNEGCKHFQGYYFGKPVTATEYESSLKAPKNPL